MRVAVLAGGRSSEHEVSVESAAAVRDGLLEAGHEPLWVEISREGRWSHEGRTLTLQPAAGLLGADVVFPVLHGPFGEDGTVQGLLELLDVAYVGAGVLASAVCMDKVLFKELMGSVGIPQVDYVALSALGEPAAGDHASELARELRDEGASPLDRLGLPVFVKPARLGSSVGISKVADAAELPRALRAAFDHDPLVIVEAMARGTEVECSVLGNSEPIASEPGEIVANADWYDYGAKYEPGGMELRIPAGIPEPARERVRELAREVFLRVGCAGMARVDFFVEDPQGEARVLVNELNTIPGFTATSVYAKLFEASGIPYTDLLQRLLELAIERHEVEGRHRY